MLNIKGEMQYLLDTAKSRKDFEAIRRNADFITRVMGYAPEAELERAYRLAYDEGDMEWQFLILKTAAYLRGEGAKREA